MGARGSNQVAVVFLRRGSFFTCDLAVASALLLAEFGAMPPEHWSVRLGPVAVGYDKWWDLAEGTDEISADFLGSLGRGLDYLERIATDEGLRDAIVRLAMNDPRPLPPLMQSWVVALDRAIGPRWVG